MRKIGLGEIDDLALGASLLGAGGGGDPYIGKLMVLSAIRECGEVTLLSPEEVADDALILPMTDDLSSAIALATRLRSCGIRTQLHCEEKKFKAKISYADRLGIPYVLFLGEDEIAAGVVTCKDMQTGEQTRLDPAATIYRIQAGLAEKNKGPVILG